ncbi:MAG: hypothetical protein K2N71_06225, partial [Oscillospiraceae bacterium]|nr:hypothetical protein [Oscillospiraceae bacterium]
MPDIIFDNHDERIKYYELMLERSLDNISDYALPQGYRFVFYRTGDAESWISIEISAKELKDQAQGIEVWEKYYGGKDSELARRM